MDKNTFQNTGTQFLLHSFRFCFCLLDFLCSLRPKQRLRISKIETSNAVTHALAISSLFKSRQSLVFTSAFQLIQQLCSCSGDWVTVERLCCTSISHACFLFANPATTKGRQRKVAVVQISSLCCLAILFSPLPHQLIIHFNIFLTDLKKTGFCAACPYISVILHPYQCALVNKKVNLDLPPHKPHRVPSPCLPLSAEPGLCARVPNPWMDTSLLNEPFLLTFLYTLIWRGWSCRR